MVKVALTLTLFTLTVMLSGCAARSRCTKLPINLPPYPCAGPEVAAELKLICDDKKCEHLNKWLNRLYLFKTEYDIYQTELKKD